MSENYDHMEERNRMQIIARNLGIPVDTTYSPSVSMKTLWGILTDEKRLKDLVARVKNRAFW